MKTNIELKLNFTVLKHDRFRSIIVVKYKGAYLDGREERYGPVLRSYVPKLIDEIENSVKKAVEGVFAVEA